MRGMANRHIIDGMLLPTLSTTSEYVHMAQEAGFGIFSEPLDISENVAKTWYFSPMFPPSPLPSPLPSFPLYFFPPFLSYAPPIANALAGIYPGP